MNLIFAFMVFNFDLDKFNELILCSESLAGLDPSVWVISEPTAIIFLPDQTPVYLFRELFDLMKLAEFDLSIIRHFQGLSQ